MHLVISVKKIHEMDAFYDNFAQIHKFLNTTTSLIYSKMRKIEFQLNFQNLIEIQFFFFCN